MIRKWMYGRLYDTLKTHSLVYTHTRGHTNIHTNIHTHHQFGTCVNTCFCYWLDEYVVDLLLFLTHVDTSYKHGRINKKTNAIGPETNKIQCYVTIHGMRIKMNTNIRNYRATRTHTTHRHILITFARANLPHTVR